MFLLDIDFAVFRGLNGILTAITVISGGLIAFVKIE